MSKELNLFPIVDHGCVLERMGARFSDDLSYSEWAEFGREVCKLSGASLWWIGDWINAGEKLYGEKYKVALKVAEFDYGTLRNIAAVCSALTLSRRRDSLSFWYHAEVAGLGAKDQDKFLKLAERNEWTRSELRQAIRRASATELEESKPGTALSFVLTRWAGDFMRWFRVQIEDTPVDDMPSERREALRRELRPIVDVYEALEAATPRKESIRATSTNR